MPIEEVRVSNFRSIQDTDWVEFDSDILTLIGGNESGKSAFLDALQHTFDPEYEYDESDLRNYRGCQGFSIVSSIKMEITDSRLRDIIEKGVVHKLGDGSTIIVDTTKGKIIPSKRLYKNYIRLINETDKYSVKFLKVHDANNISIEDVNQSSSPKDIDFSSYEPENEFFVSNYTSLGRHSKNIVLDALNSGADFWAGKILEGINVNIFHHDRADTLSDKVPESGIGDDEYRTFNNLLRKSGFDPEEIAEMDPFEMSREIDEAFSNLDEKVNDFWGQKDVEISITTPGGEFHPMIKDKAVGDDSVDRKARQPSDRSKGFQWFLSFNINVSEEVSEYGDSLLLLDDPAVFLHPEGKSNWLDAIEDLAGDAQIIYTSHSPYLIRKDSPERIRIVEDRAGEGTVVTEEFESSDDASLAPLRKALGIGLGDSPFTTKRKLITEGPSDKVIIRGVAQYLASIDDEILDTDRVSILPSTGADFTLQVAKWVQSEEFTYVILLDNDTKGNNVIERIESEAPELEEERVRQLTKDDGNADQYLEIEDMFPPEFYLDCLNAAYEDILDQFSPLSLESDETGQRYIDGEEYNGRKIVSKIQAVFDEEGYGDVDKLAVANEIEDRLQRAEVDEDVVQYFRPLLGEIEGLL